jgi:uncharacterized protein
LTSKLSCFSIYADDRPEYSSLHAIFFGPYLLAGITTGDWDAKSGTSNLVSNWISPVPSSYNSQLTSLIQQSSNKTLFVSNSNFSLTMQDIPLAGSHSSVQATFRIYPQDAKNKQLFFSSHKSNNSKHKSTSTEAYVMIEPFDMPGMVITNTLNISATKGSDSTFKLISGLDGTANSISLELGTKQGCYFSTGTVDYSTGKKIQVICRGSSQITDDVTFKRAATFVPVNGARQYNPLSFVAKGQKRNFLLEPLMGLQDEFYTVYFNVGV